MSRGCRRSGTRRAPGRPRVPGGAGAAVGADAAASAALPAGVGSRPLSRGGPSTLREPQGRREPGRTATQLRAIPSAIEGWRSLVVGFGNTANRGEASTADASTAEERADSSEVRTTDAPTAGVRVDPREGRATEPAPDPACERERRPPREEARRFADLMRRTFGLDVLACPRCGPSTLLRAIPSAIEGWWALPADRADRRGGGDRAHSAPSALAHRGPRAASGASAAPRRGSGRPEPGRRAPLLGTCSFNQDTDVAVFT